MNDTNKILPNHTRKSRRLSVSGNEESSQNDTNHPVIVTAISDCFSLNLPPNVVCHQCKKCRNPSKRAATNVCEKPWQKKNEKHCYNTKRRAYEISRQYLSSLNARFEDEDEGSVCITTTTDTPSKLELDNIINTELTKHPLLSQHEDKVDACNKEETSCTKTTGTPSKETSWTKTTGTPSKLQQKNIISPEVTKLSLSTQHEDKASSLIKEDPLDLLFPNLKGKTLKWVDGIEYKRTKVNTDTATAEKYLLRLTKGNSTLASQIILNLLRRQQNINNMVKKAIRQEISGIDTIITNRVKECIERLKSKDGANTDQQNQALMAILTAVFFDSSSADLDVTASGRKVSKMFSSPMPIFIYS